MRQRREECERHDRSQPGVVRELRTRLVAGDATHVGELLCPDVVVIVDGGGKARLSAEPAHGIRSGAELLARVMASHGDCALAERQVNGRPGLVLHEHGEVVGVLALRTREGYAIDVLVVLNPDKLRAWNLPRARITPPAS
jgi:RNA polymerase sigma-70 factor (ECF subfamily)